MITVLLASYNGIPYIAEQVRSLLEQTVPFDRLLIQDDQSTDDTWNFIQQCQDQYSSRIAACRQETNSGTPKYNFYSLMSKARDDYLMLCDQDDVWLPDKIEKTLAKMKKLEQRYGKETPLLVHTDLRVVGESLNVIQPSLKVAMNANYDRVQLRDQIIQNTLTGCTAMYNRALANLLWEETPDYMVMHDWWLMLAASAFGHIGHIDDQTILYRQHAHNEIGAKDVRTLGYKIGKLLHFGDIRCALAGTYRQADSFLRYYVDRLSSDQIAFLTEYCQIPRMGKFQKWNTIRSLGTYKNGLARSIAYFIFV